MGKTTSRISCSHKFITAGEAIDGTTGITVGTKVLQAGWLAKGSLTQVPGVFKLVPNSSSSVSYKKARHYGNPGSDTEAKKTH